jgi:hypothetical protein
MLSPCSTDELPPVERLSLLLHPQPDRYKAADGLGAADLKLVHCDPSIDLSDLLIVHADNLRLASTGGLGPSTPVF